MEIDIPDTAYVFCSKCGHSAAAHPVLRTVAGCRANSGTAGMRCGCFRSDIDVMADQDYGPTEPPPEDDEDDPPADPLHGIPADGTEWL